jgi:hypothetical protein
MTGGISSWMMKSSSMFSPAKWNQKRFQVDTGARVGSRSALDYLLRNVNASTPVTHLFGVTLKIELNNEEEDTP